MVGSAKGYDELKTIIEQNKLSQLLKTHFNIITKEPNAIITKQNGFNVNRLYT